MTTTTTKKGLVSKASSLEGQILSDQLAPTLTDPRLLVDPRALKTLFFTEDWVYILCDRIASLISAQWMRVMRDQIQDGKKIPEPAEDHPVQKLLETPNSEQDYHSFMYSLIVDELIGGNAIFWRAAASDQLLLLPSESTTIDLATDGSIKSYRVIYGDSWTQKALSFDPKEICHIRRPNPSSRIWGLSPFIPGAKAVSFNRYTGEYLVNFYQKGSQPGLILELPEGANDKQAHRLLRSIENSHTGRANQFRPMVTPKGVSVHQVAQSLADQQLIDHLNANRETILNLLQVPKHEVGLDGGRSLGSGDEYRISRANFWRGQLKSIMRRVAGTMTRFFREDLGEGYYLEFDLSDVDVLQDDEMQKADLAQKLLATHTINEVRSQLYALDPIPDGDTIGGQQPVSLPPGIGLSLDEALGVVHDVEKGIISREAAATVLAETYGMKPDAIDAILGKHSNEPDPKNLARVEMFKKSVGSWFEDTDRALEQTSQAAIPKIKKLVLGVFAKQVDLVVDILKSEKSLDIITLKELPPKRVLRKRINDALDSLEDDYMEGYGSTLEALIDVGYDSTIAVTFNQQDKLKLAAIKAKNSARRRMILEDRGLKHFAWINEETTENIMQVIENGVSEQLTIDQIIKNIATKFSDIKNIERRAEVIARTETLTAASVGQAASLNDAERVLGPMKKMWINAGDDRVRENKKYNHVKLQGQVRMSKEKFENGLMYPRDPSGDPGDVIQCRCRMVAVAAEDADAIGFGELDQENTGAV